MTRVGDLRAGGDIGVGPEEAAGAAAAPTSSRVAERTAGWRSTLAARALVMLTQLGIAGAALAAWEWVPRIHRVQHWGHIFDPFFVSSPSRVARRLDELFTSHQSAGVMWMYVEHTVVASLIGLGIGLVAGGLVGLVIGNSRFLGAVFRPFAVAMNAIPRIALIPIVVILFGPTYTGSVVISISVVFFIAFFNAYEGATTVPLHYVQNARVFEANPAAIMWHVRLPYVVAWTLASLPVAATFSVLAVVTGEILTGFPGLGRLVAQSSETADSTLAFSVVIILCVLGLLIVGIAELVKRRVLHWWAR